MTYTSAGIALTLVSHQAIFELIVTEAAYVRDLQLIVEVWTIIYPPS